MTPYDQARKKHKAQGNLPVRCNSIYMKEDSFNCRLRPSEARKVAENLLRKAKIAEVAGVDNIAAIHLWVKGKESETLYFGLGKARKGGRRKKHAD